MNRQDAGHSSTVASIEVHNRSTWPASLVATVTGRGFAEDDTFRADGIRELLRGARIRAYHCTRLLPHEGALIRQQGLRPLTETLVTDRIRQAHDAGAFDAVLRDALLASHVFAFQGGRYSECREDQVCFVVSRAHFDSSPDSCAPLLSRWGGEGIYWAAEEQAARLAALGRPSIVVADLNFDVPGKHLMFPTLLSVLREAAAGKDRSADVFYRAPVPPECIVAIWQPGDAEYDAHPRLPRS